SLDAQAHALTEIVAKFKTGVEVRRTSIQSRPAPQAARTATKQPLRAAVKRAPARPELVSAKPPIATPKSDEDGQWEAF
ncbi:MAG: hypothetical protein WCL47_09540, partial [Holophagaceae bacterium]